MIRFCLFFAFEAFNFFRQNLNTSNTTETGATIHWVQRPVQQTIDYEWETRWDAKVALVESNPISWVAFRSKLILLDSPVICSLCLIQLVKLVRKRMQTTACLANISILQAVQRKEIGKKVEHCGTEDIYDRLAIGGGVCTLYCFTFSLFSLDILFGSWCLFGVFVFCKDRTTYLSAQKFQIIQGNLRNDRCFGMLLIEQAHQNEVGEYYSRQKSNTCYCYSIVAFIWLVWKVLFAMIWALKSSLAHPHLAFSKLLQLQLLQLQSIQESKFSLTFADHVSMIAVSLQEK